jgi:hypothetical protein
VPGGGLALVVEVLTRPLDLLENAARMFEQAFAGLGQHHPAAVAVEQVLSQFDFERADLPAQCGLHDGQEGGSAREAAELRDVHEVPELLQVHDLCRSAISDRRVITLIV